MVDKIRLWFGCLSKKMDCSRIQIRRCKFRCQHIPLYIVSNIMANLSGSAHKPSIMFLNFSAFVTRRDWLSQISTEIRMLMDMAIFSFSNPCGALAVFLCDVTLAKCCPKIDQSIFKFPNDEKVGNNLMVVKIAVRIVGRGTVRDLLTEIF